MKCLLRQTRQCLLTNMRLPFKVIVSAHLPNSETTKILQKIFQKNPMIKATSSNSNIFAQGKVHHYYLNNLQGLLLLRPMKTRTQILKKQTNSTGRFLFFFKYNISSLTSLKFKCRFLLISLNSSSNSGLYSGHTREHSLSK